MLLIHPPLTKPCEPPAALAYLEGALRRHGVSTTVCDMNIEAIHSLLEKTTSTDDTWTRRAVKNLGRNITALQSTTTYQNRDKYRRAVADINHLLEIAGTEAGIQLNLANYVDDDYSPLKSEDLKRAAVHFSDNIFFPYFAKRLEQLLETSPGTYIGISLNYLSQAICSFAMIGYLRHHHPKIKIVVGGGLVTTWLSHPGWNRPFDDLIDYFIGGKGEGQLLRLLGKEVEQENCLPVYTSLTNNYLSPGFILPYTTSRGCFWKKCNFCPETSEDNPYEHIHPTRTLTDLSALSRQTRPVLIHLLDNAISSSTLETLQQNTLAAPWYGFARFSRQLTDKAFCARLRESGCIMLKIGLESGDQNVLEQMNKGIDLQLASTVLRNLEEAGIATYIYLLFGTPAENLESALKTKDFVEQHHRAISYLNLAIFNLPICSQEAKSLAVSDFYEGDLSIYCNFNHPKGWNRGKIRRFLDSTFKRSPEIASILHNDPPFFTSNHAPFLSLFVK
ncbi:radical SAM protein [Desulforhopalus sp. IMCC35007]|uniref:B12-binding domain-containing radical SAM protein n=1 Tax=Desulforhopalus sp. IMCC35007 TaxID=2569543 RepID=UPI0010AE1E45|nr:radical SAM protein [Desulforhopalus sp. IMCC35007]TKB05882.1 radical SAM protein [Desulforhopalus sp. IMCC35007]